MCYPFMDLPTSEPEIVAGALGVGFSAAVEVDQICPFDTLYAAVAMWNTAGKGRQG